jgi:23S rRNA pseudouridine2604 synthase
MDDNNVKSININKYISDTGICSRREAEKYIVEERVTINNKIAKLGNRVNPGDVVKVDGEKLKTVTNDIYIAFNKPVGIICTTELKIKSRETS